MVHHASIIAAGGGREVMNVGFGLGLVDEAIQVWTKQYKCGYKADKIRRG